MSEPPEVQSANRPGRKRAESAEEKAEREGMGRKLTLALAVLGVVYGDLGTSAIYSMHAVFTGGASMLEPTDLNVLGIVSLVFWTLIIVVSLKYMTFVLRADNDGEGGMFALIALLRPWRNTRRLQRRTLVLLGLAGAAMLYAGIMITPAISILSAVEGLQVAAPHMQSWVIPITLVILVALFAVQRFGTARIGVAFGPIMMLWFLAIAALGVHGIVQEPQVVRAVDPRYAIAFFRANRVTGYLVLFAVFLVTTGAEALYADIGNFGRRSIRRLWFAFVLPALLLNYFGQAAELLHDPHAAAQPFYHLIPDMLLYPVVVLATIATIIASQAAITGAFSMTKQAGRLGMMPRARVVQTSTETSGQVYVPVVNWVLMAAAIALVLLFRSSDKLASTYGISISTTMVVTTILAFFVARERGHWSLWATVLLLAVFLIVDLAYFGSNLMRIPHGGWFPVAVAVIFFTVMSTWRRGVELVTQQTDKEAKSIKELVKNLKKEKTIRVPGTAIFVTPRLEDTPPSVSRHIERSHALQEQVILLSVLTEDVPRTRRDDRVELKNLAGGFFRVILHYGYMQQANVPSDLAACAEHGLEVDLEEATYYIEHPSPISARGRRHGMLAWRDHLLGFLMRNSIDVTNGYQIPVDQMVDMGLRVRI